MSFNQYSLGDLCNISSSKRIFAREYSDYGVPFYRGKEIIEKFNNKEVSNELFITKEKYLSIKNKYGVPKKGDILLTSVGTLGIPFLVDSEEFYFKDGNLTWFKEFNSNVNNKFIYWWLQSPEAQHQIFNKCIGSTQKALPIKTLESFEITLPNLDIQEKIVEILEEINNKIKNCIKINQNLEKLNQQLFKEWFINFNFNNEDGKPYKSSNGLMKESTLGEIPISWEVKTIGDLAEVKGRIGWRGYTSNDLVDEGPWVVGGKEITSGFIDFSTAKHLTREKFEESPEIMLKNKDIIIAKTGTIGPLAMFYEEYGEATLNPNVGLIRTKFINSALLLTFLRSPRAQSYLKEFTTSSVQPAVNQATIKKLELPIPSDLVLLNKFEDKFEHINNLQFQLIKEKYNLEKLRDTLLPKLMSGEIDVSDVEI